MRGFLFVLSGVFTIGSVLAQDYPNKAIRIVVPFAIGGPADIYARALAVKLSEAMGQSFFVENKPGGGAVLGTDAAAKAAPDGYTLLMMSNAQTVNETLIPNKPYALMRDFIPVAPVNFSDLVLVAHPSVPAANVRELLTLAKQKNRKASPTHPADPARLITWPGSYSKAWPGWICCMCPTKVVAARELILSLGM